MAQGWFGRLRQRVREAPQRGGLTSRTELNTRPPRPRESTADRQVEVPWAVRLAAGWAWRLLVIGAAAGAFLFLVVQLRVIVVPVLVAMLITALIIPAADALQRAGLPRGAAAGITLVGTLLVVGGLLTIVGQQIASGFDDLANQVTDGIDQIHDWLVTGPLQLSDAQITQAFDSAREAISGSNSQLTQGALKIGSTVGHVATGFFLVLFVTYFLLYEGGKIWAWVVRVFPRAARDRVDASGERAWVSLTAFVRATVMVAFVDAIGIMGVALLLRVPLAVPIGVLVFLGSFIPIIGALVSGAVAVIVALVTHGPLSAVLMLAGVIAVQQLEAHILQPFLLGRLVRLHPLAIILSIGGGVYLAGITGALFAVPLVAMLNAVVTHLANGDDPPGETAAVVTEAEAGSSSDPPPPPTEPPSAPPGAPPSAPPSERSSE
jgi:predicted PurR-regulated permease PerM